MATASGARCVVAYVKEVTHGTTPGSPSMSLLRAVDRNIDMTVTELASEEIRSDRQMADARHGFHAVTGTLGGELSVGSWDDWLEAGMASTFAAGTTVTGGGQTLGATGSTFTRSAGSFVTDGYEVGDSVVTSGFPTSGNNGTWVVTAVSATVLTVDGTLSTDATSSGRTITPKKRISIGTTMTSFAVERQFPDITQYEVFNGVFVNKMNMSMKPGELCKVSFDILGMTAAALSGSSLGSATALSTNSPLSAFDGGLYEGGSKIAIVTGFDIALDNGRSTVPVVGNKFATDVYEGNAAVTGNMMAFFQSAAIFNKFVNETTSSLIVKLADINGTDFIHIVVPKVKYMGGTKQPPKTGPIIMNMPFRGLVDSVSATSFSLVRSNA